MIQIFFAGLASGFLIIFITQWIWRNIKLSDHIIKPETLNVSIDNETPYKVALIVNNDLKMGVGKVFAQCSHAGVGIYETYYKIRRSNFKIWETQGKPLSIYKVTNARTLKSLYKSADSRGIIKNLVADAGHTQIPAGSITVLAIGPERESVLNSITENLEPYT